MAESTPKAGSKLDSLPREDLVKFVKKQTFLLQKTKAKCDELTLQVESLKNSAGHSQDDSRSTEVSEELSKLQDENTSLRAAHEVAQKQSAEQMAEMDEKLQNVLQQNKAMEEEIECLKMKDTTLTSTLQCMQEEQRRWAEESQEWKDQVEVLTLARDNALDALKAMQVSKSESDRADVSNRKEEIDHLNRLLEEKSQHVVSLEKEISTLKGTIQTLEDSVQSVTRLSSDLELANSQLAEMSTRYNLCAQEKDNFELIAKDKELESVRLNGEVERLQSENSSSSKQLTELEQSSAGLKSDLSQSLEDKEKLSLLVQELESELKTAQESVHLSEDVAQSLKTELAARTADIDNLKKSEILKTESIGKLENQISDYAANVEKYQSLCQKYENSDAELRAQIAELETTNVHLKEELDNGGLHEQSNSESLNRVASELEALRQKHVELLTVHENCGKSESELKRSVAEVTEESSKLKEQLSEWESMIQMMKDDQEKTSEELFGAEEREVSCRRDLDEVTSALQEALNERDVLREELCKFKDGSAALEMEVSKLKEMVDSLKKERDDIKDVNYKNEVRMEVLEKQFSESSICNADISEMQQSLIELESKQAIFLIEKESLVQQIEQLKLAENKAEGVIDESKSTIQTLEKEVGENKLKLEQLLYELSDSKSLVDTLKEGEVILVDRFNACKAEKESLVGRLGELEYLCSEQKGHVEELESQLKVVSESGDHQKSNSRVESLTEKVKVLEDEKEELQSLLEAEIFRVKEVEKLKMECVEKLEDTLSAKDSLQQLYDSSTKQIQDLSVEIQALKKSEAGHLELNDKLQSEIEEFHVKLNEKTKAFDELRECNEMKFTEAQKQCEEESTRKIELEKTVVELQKELLEERSNLEQVQRELQKTLEHMECVKNGQTASSLELTSLQQEVISLKSLKAELEQKLRESETALERREQGDQQLVKKYDKGISDLKIEVSALKENLSSSYASLESVKADNESLSDAVTNLKEQLKNEGAKYTDLMGEFEDVSAKFRSLQALYDKFSAEQEQEEEHEEKVSHQLKREKEDIESQLRSVSEELSNLKAESWEQCEQLKKTIEDLSVELVGERQFKDELIEKVKEGDEVVDGLRREREVLSQQCEGLKKEIELLKMTSDEEVKSANIEAEKLQKAAASSELQLLQKSLQEAEEKCNKFKQLAIKGKKELAEAKKQIESLTSELATLTQMCDKLEMEMTKSSDVSKEGYDLLKNEHQSLVMEHSSLCEDLEKKSQQLRSFEEDLKKTVSSNADLKQNISMLNDEKQEITRQLQDVQSQVSELQKQIKENLSQMEADRLQKEQVEKELSKAHGQLAEVKGEVEKAREKSLADMKELETKLKAAHKELDSVKKDAKQSNVMDLEIAEYEKTVETLHAKIEEREMNIRDLQSEVTKLTEQLKATETDVDTAESQKAQAEERVAKMKQLLVKAKKELAESKKLEGEQRTSDAQLRGQLEGLVQQSEEYKVQLAELSGERMKLQEKLRACSESSQRTVRGLEIKMHSVQEDLELSRSELLAVQAEYDSYKVRVHNVLKQQKSKASSEVALEQIKLDKERLEGAVEQLKVKLQEVSDQYKLTHSERELLQEECDRLQSRYAKLQKEAEDKERTWKQKIELLSQENSASNADNLENLRQLTEQNEALSQNFKDQMKLLLDNHKSEKGELQRQLDTTERELFGLQRELQQLQSQASLLTTSSTQSKVDTKTDGGEIVVDPRREERQSGEGMEHPDAGGSQPGQPATPQPPLVSFEQLISSPSVDLDKQSVNSFTSVNEEELLRNSLNTAEKKVEHLTGLVSESEGTVLHLTEQAKILKEEIRRLERNQKRENAISNMEYLKNVVLKFLLLQPGDERERMIPVLSTMLTLSGEEKTSLVAVARGEEGSSDAQGRPVGWGAYLPRWSGLM